MYINLINLTTGSTILIREGDVAGSATALLRTWLDRVLATTEPVILPGAGLDDYAALGTSDKGALMVSVYAKSGAPLVTLGVARRPRHGDYLWPIMTTPPMPRPATNVDRPAEPWAAVTVWPSLLLSPSAAQWLPDFERCLAWAWVSEARA